MAITRKLAKLTAICFAICLAPSIVLAYPGSINLIPSTDLIGANNLRLSYESEGKDQPYDTGYTEYIYTQFGISDRLEVGLDVYDADDAAGARTKFLNAKYLVVPEGEKLPKIAVGTMFVGKDSTPSYYAVGSRTYGNNCYHVGLQTQGDRTWSLIGFNCPIAKSFTFLADYQSGFAGCGTVGVSWAQSESFGVTLYYTRYNSELLQDTSDFVGLNLAYTMPVKY